MHFAERDRRGGFVRLRSRATLLPTRSETREAIMRGGVVRLIAGVLVSAALMGVQPAASQSAPTDYPNRNIQFLIGNPPGGTFGVFARLLADGLQTRIGK